MPPSTGNMACRYPLHILLRPTWIETLPTLSHSLPRAGRPNSTSWYFRTPTTRRYGIKNYTRPLHTENSGRSGRAEELERPARPQVEKRKVGSDQRHSSTPRRAGGSVG